MVKLHVTPYKYDVALGTYLQIRNVKNTLFIRRVTSDSRVISLMGSAMERLGVVCEFQNGSILLELLSSIAQVYHWEGFNKPEQILTVQVSDSITSKYTGEYITDGFFQQ